MHLDNLIDCLPDALRPQTLSLWQEFQSHEPLAETDRFVVWLHEQNYLSQNEFHAVLQQQQIEVTSVDLTSNAKAVNETQFHGSWGPDRPVTGPLKASHYAMLGTLGQGAMGLVHLAKDQDLQRKVAYKQLIGEAQENRSALARFMREAQITAQLDHPHIVPIYSMEVGENGLLAYSMKLVQGRTFKELIQSARQSYDQHNVLNEDLSVTQMLDYFLKVCDAMAYAHSKGVIHRDLKPANIMVGRYNEVYVMDWGIARVIHTEEPPLENWVDVNVSQGDESIEDRTHHGQILGTPRYMSPQQAAGKNDQLDGRSDQFALGLILFELLTLKPAFTAKTQIELLKKVLKADKEAWSDYHPTRKIPVELQAIVDKATSKRVTERYQDVQTMADDIRRFLRGEAPLARTDNLWRQVARWIGKHREWTLMMLIAFVTCAALIVIAGLYQRQQEIVRAQQREQILLGFFTRVTQQSQQLDSFFQKMESLVEGLRTATVEALSHAPISHEPLYINNPFAAPGKLFQAPDLIYSSHYGGDISPVWPIYVLSPGVQQTQIASRLQQVAPLRHILKEVLMQSAAPGQKPMPKAQWDQLLATRGAPVLWSYICLKEGVLMFYPGHNEPTRDYDVRIRPYYTQSLNRHEKVWGAPYLDPEGGPVIPNTQAIYSATGDFLGVVGIDIRLSFLIQRYLSQRQVPAIRESLLLNAKGEIILSSKPRPVSKEQKIALDQHFKTPLYENKSVVQAILAQKTGGYLQAPSKNYHSQSLFAYYRLNTLGWYYLVEADYQKLLETESPNHVKP